MSAQSNHAGCQLQVVEDAAHCCPAYYRLSEKHPWEPVGANSAMSCFSFYANKTITTGEGGMACTESDAYAERMRIMSLHGISRDAWKRFTAEASWYYEILAPGFKYNLTDIASTIGVHQVRKADLATLEFRHEEELLQSASDVEKFYLEHCLPRKIELNRLYAEKADLWRDTLLILKTLFCWRRRHS